MRENHAMFTSRGTCLTLATLVATAAPVGAQDAPAPTLTLEEAIELALRNNPGHLAALNDEQSAEWGVREAYGAFLPTANVSSGFQYQASGSSRFGVFTAEDIGVGQTPGYYISDYSLNLGYGLSGADFFRVRQEREGRRAAIAEGNASAFTVRSAVARQYVAVLRAQEAAELARRQLTSADENLKLARARVEVGAAIPLEAMQAEVERGRIEVELLRAESAVRTEKLRLAEQIGVPVARDAELVTPFEVFEPPWEAESLVATALEAHPVLRAVRARHSASEATVRMAKSAYLPRLDVNLNWSGFTREASDVGFLLDQARDQAAGQRESCELINEIATRLTDPLAGFPVDCTTFLLTPERESAIRTGNDVFPFDFTRQPLTARLQVSLPIFEGFSRQRQVESAQVQAEDVRYQLRAEELRLRTEVVASHEALETAARVVDVQERNAASAEEQLRLTRELYRVGSATFVELLEAEALRAQAERSYLDAIFDFHDALAALEAAVGQRLAPGEG